MSSAAGAWSPTPRPGPLSGLRVLDFTWAAAGPIATSFMAWLGADVAKIEYARRPDLMRVANRQYGYPGELDLNASTSFNEIASGKRSIALNLSDTGDLDTARQLAAVADVVVENMRPGKIESLGLGYRELRELNPPVVMCSVSATGRTAESVPGYAPIFWAEGGGAWMTGRPDRLPGVVRGPVDLHVAALACVGTLALLERRKRTGEGGYVDCSGIEAVAATTTADLIAELLTGKQAARGGNSQPGMLVNDLFPAAGDKPGDEAWVAVSVRDDADLTAFCALLGEQPDDVRAALTSGGQLSDECYQQLAGKTARLDAGALARDLLARGVPAARSLSLNAALLDQRLHQRGTFVQSSHPRIGQQTIVGVPWVRDGTPYAAIRPAPDLGQDGDAILSEWLSA